MAESTRAVLAGSKGFVDAVDAQLRMRFGPALGLANGPNDTLAHAPGCELVILEYGGAEWLATVKELRGRSPGSAIVVGVPAARAGDSDLLKQAGVDEVVAWSGRADPVLWAVDRIARRAAPPPAAATTVQKRAKPRLALLRADEPGGEGAEPEAPGEPSGERQTPVAAAPSAPKLPAPPPLPARAPGGAGPARELAPATVGAAPDPAPVAPAPELASPPEGVAPPQPSPRWPLGVPTAVDVEALLAATREGHLSSDDVLRSAVEQVLKALSDVERAALDGLESRIDPAPVLATTRLRVRLEVALATFPSPGADLEPEGAQRLLAEVDAQLAALAALARSAPPGVAPALEPARSALVDLGLRMADALGRARDGEQVAAAAPAARHEPVARVLTDERVLPPVREKTPILFWIVLALAVGAGAAYHGQKLLRAGGSVPTVAGAPVGTTGAEHGSSKIVLSIPGKKLSPADLERFKAAEEAKGNAVREVSPGTWIVVPASQATAQQWGQ